jgi:hypothetical protein
MIKNLISRLFKSNRPSSDNNLVVIQLNDKIMPVDRGDVYEDPLDEFLKSANLGEVTGGGTLQKASGEIKHCDLELQIPGDINPSILISKLEELGAPKGSLLRMISPDRIIEFGKLEGLAIYLDGENLSASVYQNNDVNEVWSELSRLLSIQTQRYWEGNAVTAFYFYGESYADMKNLISDFVSNHPLCENAKVEQIA